MENYNEESKKKLVDALELAIPNSKEEYVGIKPVTNSVEEFLGFARFCAQSPLLAVVVRKAVDDALSTKEGFDSAVEQYGNERKEYLVKSYDKVKNMEKENEVLKTKVEELEKSLTVFKNLDVTDYVKLSTVTESPTGPVIERLLKNPDMFALFLRDMRKSMAALQNLDKWKKSIYYGKEYPGFKIKKTKWDKIKEFVIQRTIWQKNENHLAIKDTPEWHEIIRVLHGTVGIATESCELMEALEAYFSGKKPFDMVNAKEELADVGWYQNVLFDVFNTSAKSSFETWYQKLKLRYGTKFTEFFANNRDLKSERALLEKHANEKQ